MTKKIKQSKDKENNQNEIKKENIFELIKNATQQKSISDKKNVGIYPIPDYENILLKIPQSIAQNIDLLTKDLIIIPYKYQTNIQENNNLGLPLYYITSSTSQFSESNFVDPEDTMFLNETNTFLLRKVSGDNVMAPYLEQFSELYNRNNKELQNDLNQIRYIKEHYGIEAVNNALNNLQKNIYDFTDKNAKDNSEIIHFSENNHFISVYMDFSNNYINTLKKLSELPQSAFDKALSLITMKKNFVFDFINPANTRIDYEKQEFNFIDFIFNKNIIKETSLEKQIHSFKKSIFGINDKKSVHPPHLLSFSTDIQSFIKYDQIISGKINSALNMK